MSFLPTVSASTIIPASASANSQYFAGTTANKINGPVDMSFNSDQTICPNAALPSPTGRIDVPVKLSGSSFNGFTAPWNGTGKDTDGRHFYEWRFTGTTLTSCGSLDTYGHGRIDPGFNITKKVSQTTLTLVKTSVKVVTKIDLKTSVPVFCMAEYDSTTQYTSSSLTSVSFKSGPLVFPANPSPGPQVTQDDDSVNICLNSPAPSTYTLTTVWNVTKLTGGSVEWKAGVQAFVQVSACLGCSNPAGSTVVASSTSIVFDAGVSSQAHDTMQVSTAASGINFNWISASFNQFVFLALFSVSQPV